MVYLWCMIYCFTTAPTSHLSHTLWMDTYHWQYSSWATTSLPDWKVLILSTLEIFDRKTDTHLFNGLFSRTTCTTKHQKVKPFWILMKQEMTGWPWHQLDRICTLLQTDNHASTSSLKFLQAGCSYWCPTCSVKVLKEIDNIWQKKTAVPKLQCSTDCFIISSAVQYNRSM